MSGALPVESTARIVVRYEGIFGARSFMVRAVSDAAAVALPAALSALLTAHKALWAATTSFTDAFLYQEGNTYSNPVPFTIVQGTAGGTLAAVQFPRFYSFAGRGATGRATKASFYGIIGVAEQDDYRISGTESTALMAFRADFAQLYVTGGACDIAKSQVIWKPYANVGYNAYYQRKRRVTA